MVRIGVFGAGYWANNMIRAIQASPNCELCVVCDVNESALDHIRTQLPHVAVTTRSDDAFAVCDAVYIATPPATHAELARAALLAGKDVLVEKPMTTTPTDALNLLDLAYERDLVLMVGHTFLYSPPVMKIKELIASGELGDVYYVDSQRVNLGKHQASGVMWDLAPHDYSILLHWLGEVPTHVSARGRSFVSTSREDVAFLTLEFPSGALAEIHLSWLSPVRLRRTTVSGSQRMVIYDDTEGPEAVRVYDHGIADHRPASYGEFQLSYRHGDVWIPRLETAEPLRSEWEHFLECVETRTVPRTDGGQGFQIVALLEATDRAFHSGQRELVQWDTHTNNRASPHRPRARFGASPDISASMRQDQ